MVLELCRGPYQTMDEWGYAPGIAQIWRASADHHDNWDSVWEQIDAMTGVGGTSRSSWSKPYAWAYGDMLMTGGEGCSPYNIDVPEHCPKMTDAEYRTEITLYAILSSPLLVGTDVRNMTAVMKQTMLNKDMIMINQDYKAQPGKVMGMCIGRVSSHFQETWVRHLSNGQIAVAAPAREGTATRRICLEDLGISGEAHIKDIWAGTEDDTSDGLYFRTVDEHDVLFALVTPHGIR